MNPVSGHGEGEALSCNLFFDRVGEVSATLNSDGFSWKLPESNNELVKLSSKFQKEITFPEIYAAELMNWGLIHNSMLPSAGGFLLGSNSEMFRFVVHWYKKSKTKPSLWVQMAYTFGHKDLGTCETWVNRIHCYLNSDIQRPKGLLVFVHPTSGKRNGCRTWESVASIFGRARVRTRLIVTQRAGHAFDVMKSISDRELISYDGVVAVGGDGFFNEILNGLLSSRHKAPYPPSPAEVLHSLDNGSNRCPVKREFFINGHTGDYAYVSEDHTPDHALLHHNEDSDPLLHSSDAIRPNSVDFDRDNMFSFPNPWFRFGIIPSGSTDAIVISTTGTRDPITSALQIVLGKRKCLDIAQVVRWKASASSKEEPSVHYAASFAGYGFYGDVVKESEKCRWMGPARYDYAGTKVFMKNRSYQAEVAFLDVQESRVFPGPNCIQDSGEGINLSKNPKLICQVNCPICIDARPPPQVPSIHSSFKLSSHHGENSRWLRSKGRFISVGAAIISCRNERAPDGVVVDAHLADGFLHLILIKDCPRPLYLWHLIHLARKGADPLDFDFVEHHKTTAFTFISSGEESVWNLDGELFQAHQLSAQVFRGLISLFASGPDV
ncbi:ceramide kinase isoform X2 [Amborella trichopoda]|uniref:DAGKc domain-containing protein n=1 Tax=Amborella trichopoda TaxID=13333 RepID=W1NSU7_AMBTC|nr:ceramide kinase isoform X2 [Amborella trichopoda]ERN00182.1 hypothetical protein AMTR_s00111p00074750 [Amborella trichopoda]|eukprot:XP_006837328.1 ceramide kinase isoform X2 [Amborella trichopoda]